ncbi:MAG TPA: type II secretion system F family protein [Acidimicrobiales bacterium]|nr:type II secretion system F family protein [Acidimicrobiales bacterium]
MTFIALLGVATATAGLLAALTGIGQRRVASTGAADWLTGELRVDHATALRREGSAVERALIPLVHRFGERVASLTPSKRLDEMHEQLLHAGLATSMRAEELLTINVLAAASSVLLAIGWIAAADPPARLAVAGALIVVTVGVAGPRAWLRRRIDARREAIFKSLPDALDLMVIGMEAGVTFDGAIQVVADRLRSPLGEELGRTLAEMELGLTRRDALQNLRRRTDVPELSAIVTALLQADALGMSVSRVLRVQANEMRAKRRQWAREKAGKLPVKILFPLIAFIFPPVMVIIIGPVVGDIASIF